MIDLPSLVDPDAKFLAVEARLRERYGDRQWRTHGPPLDVLVGTVLSQHTSDVNTDRAFDSLRRRFPTWPEVAAAPTSEVVAAIHRGGLANIKASRIQMILQEIADEGGTMTLAHLGQMALDDARRWLLALHGVGPKTAACVLLFSLGKPALPVDTHVHRVSKRLGLIGPGVGAEVAHGLLEARLGESRDRVYAFHLNMIAHGRLVCTAMRPFCERCPITEHCDFFFSAKRERA
jgi:endonuclease-3